jgi:ketosteroid isomerase-like protein
MQTDVVGGGEPTEAGLGVASEVAERPPTKAKRTAAPRKPPAKRGATARRARTKPTPRAEKAAPREQPPEAEHRGLASQLGGLVTGAGGVVLGTAKVAGRTATRLGTTIGRSTLGAGRAVISTTERMVGSLRPAAHAEAEANAATVRRAYRALLKRDLPVLEQLIADDVVWHVPGRSALAGDYSGREGIARLFGSLSERSGGTLRVDLHDVTASGEHAVALHELRATREETKLTSKQLVVFHIHAGRITEVWGPVSMTPYEDDGFWGAQG